MANTKFDARLADSPLWEPIQKLYAAMGISPHVASEDISEGRLQRIKSKDGTDYIYYCDSKREGAIGIRSGRVVLDSREMDAIF